MCSLESEKTCGIIPLTHWLRHLKHILNPYVYKKENIEDFFMFSHVTLDVWQDSEYAFDISKNNYRYIVCSMASNVYFTSTSERTWT